MNNKCDCECHALSKRCDSLHGTIFCCVCIKCPICKKHISGGFKDHVDTCELERMEFIQKAYGVIEIIS